MEALGYELHTDNLTGISVTTVCPWFIDTGMFAGVNPGVVSFLKAGYVADQIVDAILRNQKLLLIPRSMYCYLLFKSMTSVKANFAWMDVMGCNQQMDTFSGVTVQQQHNESNASERKTSLIAAASTGKINAIAEQSTPVSESTSISNA
jgi:all-trans-retinol dehydrogenase (NAD+)